MSGRISKPWKSVRRAQTALCGLLLLGGCQSSPSPTATLTPQPISSQQAQERATRAFAQLGGQLKAELETAIAKGGAVQAIEVCRERAPAIAEQLSQEHGFALGRSSHRWRNPANAPAPEVKEYLAAHSRIPGKEASVTVLSGPEHFTVIAPIVTQPLCLTCHGDPKGFSQPLKAALQKGYPDDRATGFKAGDLRGVFWAKVPNQTWEGMLPGEAPASRRIPTH